MYAGCCCCLFLVLLNSLHFDDNLMTRRVECRKYQSIDCRIFYTKFYDTLFSVRAHCIVEKRKPIFVHTCVQRATVVKTNEKFLCQRQVSLAIEI